jgi:sugar phosphate isomerase/epimerase
MGWNGAHGPEQNLGTDGGDAMQLGYATNPRRNPVDEIEWAGDHGFDFVDLMLEPDAAAAENVSADAIRLALTRKRLGVVGHTAWYLPIGSPMRQLRDAAVTAIEAYLEVFRGAGARLTTVHAHWPPSMFTADEGIAWQVETLRRAVAAGTRIGVGILYEPVGAESDTPENTLRVLDAVPGLGLHVDIGHCNLWGRQPVDLIRRFAGHIRHVHLHDNDGRGDLHLPPGTGKIEWPPVLAALRAAGYDGTVTLEVFSRDRDYLLLAKRKIEALLGKA